MAHVRTAMWLSGHGAMAHGAAWAVAVAGLWPGHANKKHSSSVDYCGKSLYPEREKASVNVTWRAPCGAPRLNVALARLVDPKAALLAETRARGPDGSRMRSPQLAR